MDQTKLFQLRTALLWESAYGCMTTRRLIIQWSQKILIIDIIISWKLLWDQRPQTIRILHEWNTETPHFQSKRVLVPELLTCSRENRLPNRIIQITRIDQTLPILTHWGRVAHICVGNLPIIESDNGLSPCRRQAIIWTNAGLLLIGPLGTNFSEILIEILTFSLKKYAWKCRLRNDVHLFRPQWVNTI